MRHLIYLRSTTTLAALVWLTGCVGAEAARPESGGQKPAAAQLKVFLDCENCYADYLQTSVTFVDYVRDRTEAEVHVLITRAETAAGGFEYTFAFIGRSRFDGLSDTLKTVTESAATDDIIRRQLATSLRAGLVRFLTRDGVPPELKLEVTLGSEAERPAVAGDRWRNWVFSLQGSASVQGEESNRSRELGASASADRITPDWKITLGFEIDHEHEEFDLDEDEPVSADRRERDFNWLVVKSAGEHWSFGARGEVESSTFDNTELAIAAAPAVEFNFFPYSQYHEAPAARAVWRRCQQLSLLRGDAVRKAGGDASQSRAVADARAAGALGLDRSKHRMVAVPARFVEVPARGDGTDLVAPGARAVGRCRDERVANPRSAVDSGARRH